VPASTAVPPYSDCEKKAGAIGLGRRGHAPKSRVPGGSAAMAVTTRRKVYSKQTQNGIQ